MRVGALTSFEYEKILCGGIYRVYLLKGKEKCKNLASIPSK